MSTERPKDTPDSSPGTPRNFVRDIVDGHNAEGRFEQRVHTRFPPEPNGYLHIGHAKAICVSFGIAKDYDGLCNLRFDDTNPVKEDVEYVDSIQEDVRWLGFTWNGDALYASDYFERLFEDAMRLIDKGLAYVDDQSAEEVRKNRGTLTEPGKNSPNRDRTPEENRDLFTRMRAGEFDDGACVLRAKIDMADPNMTMRDPAMYRIKKAHHHRTGDAWPIYPTYDWAHGQSDSYEGITHSICTLEFENHRPLYEWFLDALGAYKPQQIEFARLQLGYTMMSKRKLLQLVEEGRVSGWDDPRMPTLAGFRRRGYTPESIRSFCDQIGVAKYNSRIDVRVLENSLREDLNARAHRRMAVINPLKVVITNYPEGESETLEVVNHPGDESFGTRQVPFSRTLYIEREDFMEDPPKKFFRLGPGREVRLRAAYYITCEEVVKEGDEVVELRCTYDPATRGGSAPDGRKVKGTLHWVSGEAAVDAEVRLYDHLFSKEDPTDVEEGEDFLANLSPDSLRVLKSCKVEPALADARPGESFQFERLGYFCADLKDHSTETPVFNRSVSLRDSWKPK